MPIEYTETIISASRRDERNMRMNFHFQQMKPIIQQDFDRILDSYPTDLSHIVEKVPVGGDPYARKRILMENAAQLCPVHLFPHYPFAFEIDVGQPRHICYIGIGNECYHRSGVDFAPLRALNQQIREMGVGSFNDYTDFLHHTLDHDKLLAQGFRGVYETCEKLNRTEDDPQKRAFRELVMTCCRCVETIGLRLRALAREMLPDAQDEDARYNLSRIAASVNTPWEPPVTLFDALNAMACVNLFISGLDGVEVNAGGQLDRLVNPFYQRDLAEGRITEEEAFFLIQCYLHKTDMHCHFNDERKTYDNGVSVAIGGCDPDGRTVYNAVTDLILRAYTDNRLINPKLNARASADSPRAYLEKLVCLMQTGNNNLIIQNDDAVIPMFLRMGVRPEDARTYLGNGCQEVACRNQVHNRAFVYINMPRILLDTLRYTSDTLPQELRALYRYGAFDKTTFGELQTSFLANLRSFIRMLAEAFAPYEAQHAFINPQPLFSAMMEDCVARGRDITQGGVRYHHKTLAFVGFGTLCDSLLSVRRAMEAGTLSELLRAVEEDFRGSEPLRAALAKSKDRFGHSAEADRFAKELADALAGVSRGIYSAEGVEWRTSLFTYYQFANFGRQTGATPDGRHAGEPLSRQMNMARVPDLTTAALSMSALSEADFNDVGVFDFPLPYTLFKGEPARQAFVDFIRTCLQLKLPVLQPNVADVQTLREEQQHKGTHPDLVVRVCGYSALFGQLAPEMQEEIIRRAAG